MINARRLMPWIAFAGLILLLTGLVVTGLHGFFTPVSAGLCLLGLVLGLLLFVRQTSRNLVLYLQVFLYSAFFVGTLFLLYLVMDRHGLSYDATKRQLHSLSPITVNFVKRLPQPVRITAFVTEADKDNTRLLLEQYRVASPKISYELLNPFRDVVAARRFGAQVMPGDIYIEALTTSTARASRIARVARLREEDITNGIVQALRAKDTVLYFLTGHSEMPLERDTAGALLAGQRVSLRDLAWVRNQLTRLGMQVRPLSLVQRGRVPADASAVLWVWPKADLTGTELEILRRYLDDGGRLLVFLAPDLPQAMGELTSPFRNVASLLERYGILLTSEVVARVTPQANVDHFAIPVELVQHPITQVPGDDPLVFFYARPVQPKQVLPPEVRLDELLRSSADCLRLSAGEVATALIKRENLTRNVDPKELSAVPLGVAAMRLEPGKPEERASRIVVIGNADFLSSERITQKGWLLLNNMIAWAVQAEEMIAIPTAEIENTPMVLTDGERQFLFLLMVIVVPVTVGLIGVGFTLARREMQ